MDNTLSKKNPAKGILIPFIITLVGAILLVSTLIMPYATATGEFAEKIKEYPNEMVYDELGMTASDVKNISMIEYAKIYASHMDTDSALIINVILVAVIGAFALLTLLFMLLKLPIPTLIFDLLSLGVFCLQNWDYTDRGVIPSSTYDWGMAYYVFFIAAVAVLAGAIWMKVCKVKTKKEIQA